VAHTVLTDPASLAWTFNVRGNDVPHTPLALGFVILSAEGRPRVFLHPGKLSVEVRTYLEDLADLHAPEALLDQLGALAPGTRIGLDESMAADRLRSEEHTSELQSRENV